jgi:hypothetical protein
MTYLTNVFGKTSTNSSSNTLDQTAYNFTNGTAQAGTTNTITLATGASAVDDTYNGYIIEILTGHTHAFHNLALITDYVGSTRVATISPNWYVIPDSTIEYVIHRNSGVIQSSTHNTLTLRAGESATNDIFNNCHFRIIEYTQLDGSQVHDQIGKIIDYDGSTKIATIEKEFRHFPDTNYVYIVYEESGIASAGGSSTITLDGNQSASVVSGLWVIIEGGTGFGQMRNITDITSNVATVGTAWTTQPDTSSVYVLYGGWGSSGYDDVKDYSNIDLFVDLKDNSQYGMIVSYFSYDSTRTIYNEYYNLFTKETVDFAITPKGNYYGIKLLGFGTKIGNTGATATIQAIFGIAKNQAMSNINSEVVDSSNAQLVRSTLTGKDESGIYHNVTLSHENALNVNISNNKTAFGEILVGSLTPILQLQFPYKIFSSELVQYSSGSSVISRTSTSKLQLSTGTTTASQCFVHSKRIVKYEPGQGVDVRFTAVFTTGIANTTQCVGIGTDENGFFFGYNGASFGVSRVYGGQYEYRVYTVTNGCTVNGTLNVQLNGQTATNVSVTTASQPSVTQVAKAIADADYSSQGFRTIYQGNRVAFVADKVGSRSGSYSITVNSTGVVGSFSTLATGASNTTDFIAQTAWNADKADGHFILPTLVQTNGNVFKIVYQWLGFGHITFLVTHPSTGVFIPVHRIKYANDNTNPSIYQPSNELRLFVDNDSTTSDIIVESASLSAFTQGKLAYLGPRTSTANSFSIGTTEEVLLVLRVKQTINSITNKAEFLIDEVTFGNTNNTNIATFNVTLNPEITNTSSSTTLSFNDATTDSIVEVAKPGVSDDFSISGGTPKFTILAGANGTINRDLPKEREIRVSPNDIIVVSAYLSSGNGTLISSLSWIENI